MKKESISEWCDLPIEDLFEKNNKGVSISQGWSPQCEKESSNSEDEWGVLKTTSIQPGYFLEEHNKKLPAKLEPRPQLEVKEGDLLMTCAGPRNRCGVPCLVRKTRKRLMISGKMYRFRINEKIAVPSFVEAYLLTQKAWKEIDRMKTGISDSGLNLTHSKFKKLLVPITSLPTQRQIVFKIEELFSEVDKGIEELKTAQQQLKVYRQAVLKWAFEGKLTNEHENEGELPKGWSIELLGGLMESVRNGYSKKPDDNGNFRILRISSVRPNKVDVNELRLLQTEIGEENTVEENDLLFTRYNGSIEFVGVCGRVPKLSSKLFYPDKLIRCRPLIKEAFHSVYIQYATNYGSSRKFVLSKIKTTAGQTGISGTDVKSIPIPLAPLEEQQQIVQEIESRLSVCDKIEETIIDSLKQAEALRQSILKKAFEGKLL